jgi:hypothetical protein
MQLKSKETFMSNIKVWSPHGCFTAVEHPLSELARHEPCATLRLLDRVADGQVSLRRHEMECDLQRARIEASRDLAIAHERTKALRSMALASVAQTAIAHSMPRPLRRIRVEEDRGGCFSSTVCRLTVEMD